MKTRLAMTMKKFYSFIIFLALLLTGCTHNTPTQIAATTLPVYEFTSFLCENTSISVTQLITENVSCLHNYSIKVSQMRALSTAQVIVISGAGLEDFLNDALTDSSRIIDASSDIVLSSPEDHDHSHSHDHEHHHEYDPHIWLSPDNAMQMCRTIANELTAIYPEFGDIFEQNLQKLLSKLDTLQMYGEVSLHTLSTRDLITFHDGFSYFADSFHLHILKAIEEESGSEASAMELVELIHLVEDNELPAIFTEVNGSTGAAQIIATETGTVIYQLDMAMAGISYFDAMYHNIDTIKEALG